MLLEENRSRSGRERIGFEGKSGDGPHYGCAVPITVKVKCERALDFDFDSLARRELPVAIDLDRREMGPDALSRLSGPEDAPSLIVIPLADCRNHVRLTVWNSGEIG